MESSASSHKRERKQNQKSITEFMSKKRERDDEPRKKSISKNEDQVIGRTYQNEYQEMEKADHHWKRIKNENINEILIKQKEYIYGNYPTFYYKRYLDSIKEKDNNLSIFKGEWFEGKNVLDIGCNEGVITILIAETFKPKRIMGIDIDHRLIKTAIKNTKSLMRNSICSEIVSNADEKEIRTRTKAVEDINQTALSNEDEKKMKAILDEIKDLPKSFQLTLGSNNIMKGFNDNIIGQIKGSIINSKVCFQQENYVSEIKTFNKVTYDTILALSVLKWVHLNYGDIGVKIFFYNAYHQLNKEGLFIVEPQQWSSYKKKAKLSKEMYRNYKDIKLKPNSFLDYLMNVYDFKLIKTIICPANSKKQYYRTIYVLQK